MPCAPATTDRSEPAYASCRCRPPWIRSSGPSPKRPAHVPRPGGTHDAGFGVDTPDHSTMMWILSENVSLDNVRRRMRRDPCGSDGSAIPSGPYGRSDASCPKARDPSGGRFGSNRRDLPVDPARSRNRRLRGRSGPARMKRDRCGNISVANDSRRRPHGWTLAIEPCRGL
jgi:hypothetical protein